MKIVTQKIDSDKEKFNFLLHTFGVKIVICIFLARKLLQKNYKFLPYFAIKIDEKLVFVILA